MGKQKGPPEDDGGDGIGAKSLVLLRSLINCFATSKPPEPAQEVVDLLCDMRITPRQVMGFYKTFKMLKSKDSIMLRTGPNEASTESMTRLVRDQREWVYKIVILLLDLAGFRDTITWDGFLYVFIQFCALSKLELCQVMFYVISKEMKSWTVHYLTSSQLEEFFDDWYECPVSAFNTSSIHFAKLPLAKYRMHDFIELCYRFSQLINPCMHLQRSLQQSLPNLRFWSDFDNIRVYNRRITIDFFRYKKVVTLLEMVRSQGGASTGPLEKIKNEAWEKYQDLLKNAACYSSPEEFDAAILKARKMCFPHQAGMIPLPLGKSQPALPKMHHEMELPAWMHKHLEGNEDPVRGIALGHAAAVEDARRDKAPKWTELGGNQPKSVEEAKAFVIATFGKHALRDKIRVIDTTEFTQVAKPASEETRMKNIVRSQELEFIRKSRQNVSDRNIVRLMQRSFQEELIDRSDKL